MFYIVWFLGQKKLSGKWKLALVLAGPLSQVYIRENTRLSSWPDVLLTMDKSMKNFSKKCSLLLPLVWVSKMIQSFFILSNFAVMKAQMAAGKILSLFQ